MVSSTRSFESTTVLNSGIHLSDMHPLVTATAILSLLAAVPYLGMVVLWAHYRPAGSPMAKNETWTPTVSVVLPTYDEERIVASKLVDICSLDYPPERLEVIVADSSDDGTADVVREFFAEREAPGIKLIEEEERRGVASAANEAVAAASGEVVFRTDCDSELAPDALREAVATLAHEDVAAVTGSQAEVLGESEVEADYRDMLARLQAVETRVDSTFIAHGPCFAFDREAFQPLRSDTVADDTEIAVGVRRRTGRVVMDPAIRFAESGVSDFSERRSRKDRRAMGLIQTLWRNRDMLGHYGDYGRWVLPFNWWFMIISPWLAVATAVLGTAAAVTLVGWAGLTLPAVGLLSLWLGQRDLLGPLQPLHAVADAQVSLLVGGVKLALGRASGTWEIDRDSREVFE